MHTVDIFDVEASPIPSHRDTSHCTCPARTRRSESETRFSYNNKSKAGKEHSSSTLRQKRWNEMREEHWKDHDKQDALFIRHTRLQN